MLKCRDIARLSSDYLEKDLSAWKRFMFGLHLLMCGRCREFIRHLKISMAMFDLNPDKHLDDEEAAQITRRVIERNQEK